MTQFGLADGSPFSFPVKGTNPLFPFEQVTLHRRDNGLGLQARMSMPSDSGEYCDLCASAQHKRNGRNENGEFDDDLVFIHLITFSSIVVH